MPNPVLEDLRAQVETTNGVIASAVAVLNGIAARIQAAVDAALANGATAEELAPVTAEVASLTASTSALADAVATNP